MTLDHITPIEKLQRVFLNDIKTVDTLILERMGSTIGLIPNLVENFTEFGGRRLHSLLTLASSSLCGYKGESHYKLAAAVELIFAATTLHNQVMAHDEFIRDKKSSIFFRGNSGSILLGDFLFAQAFNLMVESNSLSSLGILSNAAHVIAEGEVQQLSLHSDINMTDTVYLKMIAAKAATLFSAATEVSSVIAGRSENERKALCQYGMKLGMALQLVDNLLNYTGNRTTKGESIGSDFREARITLPVIYAISSANMFETEFWKRVVINQKQRDGDLLTAVSILRNSGALEATIKLAERFSQEAKEELWVFPKCSVRETLQELAVFVLNPIKELN